MALAFGSDLRIGPKPRGVRRFDRSIRATVIDGRQRRPPRRHATRH